MSTKPQHKTQGDPCTLCGLPSRKHRQYGPRNTAYDRQYNQAHPRANPSARIIGIDGEGVGRNPHRYFYLAAADEFGASWCVRPAEGADRLTSEQCLDFILSLPRRALIMGYAFVYDLTKILTDLPDQLLYHLFHEETRALPIKGASGEWRITYTPVVWGRYRLNFMNRRLTLERHAHGCQIFSHRKGRRCDCGESRRATLWDVFAFFQGKFVDTLIKWGVAAKERLTRMAEMKEKRAVLEQLPRQVVEDYCDEECEYLAKLGRSLIVAHQDAGLKLTQYYGAGSTASALLKKFDVLQYRGEFPKEMRSAVAHAFFGGRFENSHVGPIKGPVYNYDISSAYPYQATLLPCLACGKWEHVSGNTLERRIRVSRLALIKWSIGPIHPAAWGVFPVRSAKDGTIAFPLAGEGGWTWKQEFLTARKLNPYVETEEAWVYDTDCDHAPFNFLPSIYRERIRVGKDARGIVLKLGPNSVYGKLAQSRGLNPIFQSWIWSGNITSGTRAQLLDSLLVAKDPWNILMFATDGVWSREPLTMPMPADTGTSDLAEPLGGWTLETFERGVFAVRPGIYFPLQPTEDQLKKVRARGLGKRVLYDRCHEVVKGYASGAPEVEIAGVERFHGVKSSVVFDGKKTYKRAPIYGEWRAHKIKVKFKPAPKRRARMEDGRLEPWSRLPFSAAYKKSLMSWDKLALLEAQMIADEQPDAEFMYDDHYGDLDS